MASKLTYRSPLIGSIHTDYVKSLCHVLVAVSGEVAKTYTERRFQERSLEKEDQNSKPNAPLRKESNEKQNELNFQDTSADDRSYENNANIMVEEFGPDSEGIKNGDRPVSPGTLTLLCDERDPILITPEKNCANPRMASKGSKVEILAKQERIVLTKLRDTLYELVTLGRIKAEEKCASLATRSDSSGPEASVPDKASSCYEEPLSDNTKSVQEDLASENTISIQKQLAPKKTNHSQPEMIIKKQNTSHIRHFLNHTESTQLELLGGHASSNAGKLKLDNRFIPNQEMASQQKPEEKATSTSSPLEPVAYDVVANHSMPVACCIASKLQKMDVNYKLESGIKSNELCELEGNIDEAILSTNRSPMVVGEPSCEKWDSTVGKTNSDLEH
ncbi:hypothetical protein HPP92_021677 [Vanilla planifolia]|uniref:Uncharacterized protein n=1 Tax=Vanilla planifolia TaxID=51239 RepID=A0A835UHU2_VANPL|nr:hypothetical protein HPP92_021677 [Vanilla planifolia]